MRLTDVENMRLIDEQLGEQGFPVIIPMEHVGKAVADVAVNMLGDNQRVVILAGKGNNGGDGFAAARWLTEYGKKVQCFGVGMSQREALTEYTMLINSGAEVLNMRTQSDLDYLAMSISRAGLVIDALLGTGFTGTLNRDMVKICDLINGAKCPVLSVDIPTGVEAVSGAVAEHAVAADVTVTLARPKVGMLLYPAREYVGDLLVAKIGFPPKLLAQDASRYYLVDKEIVQDLLPLRADDAHKGDNGRVTVVAGSKGFVGAAALCSRSAVKIGAGLVTLLTPASVSQILAVKLDEEMVRPLTETESGTLAPEAVQEVLNFGGDVLAMGPGLGTSEGTRTQILEIIRQSDVPMVLDADVFTALQDHLDALVAKPTPKVLTPHAGEFSRLLGLSVEEVNSNRLALAMKYAKMWNVVLVLKGAPTIVALPSGVTYLVDSGTSAMATGGSGDVLTGVIAGLMAQGLDADAAAVCGTYLHGLAGRMATEGVPGLAAGEITDNLFRAWQAVEEDDEEEEVIANGAIRRVP